MTYLKIIILSFLFCQFTFSTVGQQIAISKIGLRSVDTNFNYVIKNPVYEYGSGPVITLDEAHYNLHTLSGLYHPFGRLLQNDGYILKPGRTTFTSSDLATIKILVIANALPDTGEWKLPAKSAFTNQEIIELNNWVSGGGNLLLITDHMPFPGAASQLALSFGFNFVNGYALRKDKKPEIFSRKLKNLTSNKITNGRNQSEQVDSIRIFAGSAFIAPENATAISKLDDNYQIFFPSTAREMNDSTPVISGHGLVNGAFMEYGKGRLVVFGEAALFSAQIAGPQNGKMGMNNPQAKQNPQLLLNIIHWLDRKF
jgi:hypothetical protein